MAVICSDINDRNGDSSGLEAVPQLDPGLIVQVDIENNAKGLVDIVVILESLSRLEQHAVIAVLSQ